MLAEGTPLSDISPTSGTPHNGQPQSAEWSTRVGQVVNWSRPSGQFQSAIVIAYAFDADGLYDPCAQSS